MNEPSRLIWLDVTQGDSQLKSLWKCLDRHVKLLSEPDFQVTLAHCSHPGGGIRHPATRVMQDAVTLAEAYQLRDRADALVVGCWGAPRQALKSALGIPVVGVGEAAITLMRLLAESTAIITVAQRLERAFTADVQDLTGNSGFVVPPVRALREPLQTQDLLRAVEDPTELIERFEQVAEDAVRDGADAILTGCGYLGPIFASHGYDRLSNHAEIPVVDCTQLTVATIKMLHKFKASGLTATCATFDPLTPDTDVAFRAAASGLL